VPSAYATAQASCWCLLRVLPKRWWMMVMTFICSCRNNNHPNAMYPLNPKPASGLRPTLPGPVDPAHSTCILCAARPCSSAVHYLPPTRPPDMCIASPDMLVTSYCYLEMCSSPSVGPCLEGRNIDCIHWKRFRSRLTAGDPETFADIHFGWTCDLRAPPALVWRAT